VVLWTWDGLLGGGHDFEDINDAYIAFQAWTTGKGDKPDDWKEVEGQESGVVKITLFGPGSYYLVAVETYSPSNAKASSLREVVVEELPPEVNVSIMLSTSVPLTAAVGVEKLLKWTHPSITGMEYTVQYQKEGEEGWKNVLAIAEVDGVATTITAGIAFEEAGKYSIRITATKTVDDVTYRNNVTLPWTIEVTLPPVAPTDLEALPVAFIDGKYVSTITFTADNTTGKNPTTSLYYFDRSLFGTGGTYPENLEEAVKSLLEELEKGSPNLGRIGWSAVNKSEVITDGKSSWEFKMAPKEYDQDYYFVCVTQDVNTVVPSDAVLVTIPSV